MLGRDQIIEQALALGLEDRVVVIAALQQSLDAGSADALHDVDAADPHSLGRAAYIAELERRIDGHRNGTITDRPIEEFLAELEADRAGGSAP